MLILGIETSCDETALALYHSQKGLLGHVLHSQVALHAQYGGVVPELASRKHIQSIAYLYQQLLQETNVKPMDLNGIAYTSGPGLMGALLVGACFGKALGYALQIPTIGIHHLEGHLLAPLMEDEAPTFPFVALLVSGGHTLLMQVTGLGQYQLLGESLDDAAGEAFDKTAKLLGLGYPGGAALSALAKSGASNLFKFPRPLTDKPGLNFSFSGLKTFTANLIKRLEDTPQNKADIAKGFEEALVDTLVIKCKRALQQTGLNNLVVAGGVGANEHLRAQLKILQNEQGLKVFFPRIEFCTDNGAMIAYAGLKRFEAGFQDPNLGIQVKARWPIDSLIG